MHFIRKSFYFPSLLCIFLAGCSSDFAVPDEAQLGCAAEAGCLP